MIKAQFNSITADNAMKMASFQPKEGQLYCKVADSIVNFAVKNSTKIRGHNLCWYEQVPYWMFVGKDGKEVLLKSLKDQITAVVPR